MSASVKAALVALCLSGVLAGQDAKAPEDKILDVLVFGNHVSIEPAVYPPAVRAELERHLARARAYRSSRPLPRGSELRMVHAAQVGYERLLVAVSSAQSSKALAAAYVTTLRPCYEWEGFHDCPEREAIFADRYLAARPSGPFSHYLPLLSAHRWLCTAEGYEYEKKPDAAVRSRRSYEEKLSTARLSPDLLIRTAAEQLATRNRCFSRE